MTPSSNHGPRTWSLALLALLLALPILPAQGDANIVYRSGGRERTEDGLRVSEDSFERIAGRRGPARIQIATDDLISIEYLKPPRAYQRAMSAFGNSEFAAAAKALAPIAAEKRSSRSTAWVPAYANWNLARALARLGDVPGALAAIKGLRRADPKHRFVPAALVLASELELQRGGGGPSAARRSLGDLKRLKAGKRYERLAMLAEARIDLAENKAEQAMKMLSDLEREAGDDSTTLNLARLEMAKAYVAKRDFAMAAKRFESILADKQAGISPEVRAGAVNGLGDCLYEQRKWNEAFRAYSKTFAWFIDDDLLASEVAHALHRGGDAIIKHAGTVSDPKAKKMLNLRGTLLLRRAVRDFGDTRGGQAAAKQLGT